MLTVNVPRCCSIYFALIELSNVPKYVPFITDAQQVPCVWDISSVLAPCLRKMHDFESVHHVWFLILFAPALAHGLLFCLTLT